MRQFPPQQQYQPSLAIYQPPPPQYQQPPAPQMQQYQAPPMQAMNVPQQGTREGYVGRGFYAQGGRGWGHNNRGHGGCGGRCNNNGWNNGDNAANWQQPQNNGGGFYRTRQFNNRTPNPVKRFNNWFYCWSHSFYVDHTSQQCQNPAYGHVYEATRDNICGGCCAKEQKTILHENNMGQGGADVEQNKNNYMFNGYTLIPTPNTILR